MVGCGLRINLAFKYFVSRFRASPFALEVEAKVRLLPMPSDIRFASSLRSEPGWDRGGFRQWLPGFFLVDCAMNTFVGLNNV